MSNPFETLEALLKRVEANQIETLQYLRSSAQNTTPRVGGKELAREITGLSYARIYTLVSERSIPHAKRGNRLFFNETDLRAWVAEGKRSTVAQ
jgi:predicted DNA-binding transcriptional regulator AlpA